MERRLTRYAGAIAGLFLLSAIVSAAVAVWPAAVPHRNLPLLAVAEISALVVAVWIYVRPGVLRRFNFAYVALALTAMTVLATGGTDSPLQPLYFIAVAGTALFSPFRRLLPVSIAAGLLSFSPLLFFAPTVDFLVRNGVLVALMFVLAYLASFLLGEAREQRRVRGLLEDIFRASSFQEGEELGDLLESVVAVLRRLTSADYVICYLLSDDGRQLTPEAVDIRGGVDDEAEALRSWPIPFGRGVTGWVARTGDNVLTPDLENDPRSENIPGTPTLTTSAVFVPLKLDGQVLGVLRLSRRGRNRFKETDLQMARIFARHATFAIQNARLFAERGRLYRQMRSLSITDGLTGLYNQRYLGEVAPKLLDGARAEGRPLSVLMIDSDCLKQVNDQFGHAAGDRFLVELGKLLRQEVRDTDTLVRYAGDEFIVLLPDAGTEQAQRIADRIRSAAEHISFDHVADVAVSIGIATYPDHANDLENLLHAADQALYRSKAAGRNRCTVYSAVD